MTDRRARLSAMGAAIAGAALLAASCASSPATGFSPRPTAPRVAPVDKSNLTQAQADMLASRRDLNIYTTLAHHPGLYARWSPLGQVLLNNTNVQARHREMAMLRMGWLCQAEYEWAQHARIAKASAGLDDADLRAIAEGPQSQRWNAIDRAVLTMADEIRYSGGISDTTWTALRTVYSDQQIIELMFTSAQYQLVSMALNSLGVQDEPSVVDHLPTGLPLPSLANRPSPARSAPRVAPLVQSDMSETQAALVAAHSGVGGEGPNLNRTLVSNPRIYEAWLGFMSYLSGETDLPPREREMLILRTAWLWNSDYAFAHHRPLALSAGLTASEFDRIASGPDARGWTEREAALLRAADELRREAFLSDATWAVLQKYYSTNQTLEIIYTVGGYGMTAIAIRSLGIQTEPGLTGFPD